MRINNSALLIREATPADYSEMQTLQIECIRGLVGTYTLQDMETWIERLEHTGPRYADYNNLICVDDADRAAAFVSWRRRYSGHIECLYSHEAYRGQGLGSLLLRHAEANLEGIDIKLRSTLNAQSFYEKRGYQFVTHPHDSLFPTALMEKQPQR